MMYNRFSNYSLRLLKGGDQGEGNESKRTDS
jgi:hypothetical protein